jgi:hypothetical protein
MRHSVSKINPSLYIMAPKSSVSTVKASNFYRLCSLATLLSWMIQLHLLLYFAFCIHHKAGYIIALPSANSILLHIHLMENLVATTEPLAIATLLRTYLDEISFIDDQPAKSWCWPLWKSGRFGIQCAR